MKLARIVIVSLTVLVFTACGSSAARYNNDGNEDFEAEEYAAALENYTAAKQEDPDLAQPYYNSGNTYYRQGNLDSAELQTKQSIRTAERTEDEALAQQSLYNLGNNYFQRQEWPDAIEAYKEALRLDPTDQDAKYNLELALQQQQQEQQPPQQQGGGGGQPPPEEGQDQQNQGQQGQEPNQGQNGDEEQEGGGGQPEQDEEGQSGGQQDQPQNQGGQRGLTPQEAGQLLDALGQNSQTLQERLQEGFFSPGLPPSEDW